MRSDSYNQLNIVFIVGLKAVRWFRMPTTKSQAYVRGGYSIIRLTMKRFVSSKTDQELERNPSGELSEGMEALAEARQEKRTLPIHMVDSGTTKRSEELKVFIS